MAIEIKKLGQFFKKRGAEEAENTEKKSSKNSSENSQDEQEIEDPKQIERYLKKALLEEERLEIQLGQRTRVFFTYLMDHPPEEEEEAGEEHEAGEERVENEEKDEKDEEDEAPEGEAVISEAPQKTYEFGDYLGEHDRLMVHPLIPYLGNAQIRTSEEVLLRFFQGTKAVEMDIGFVEITTIREEQAIQLTYPEWLYISAARGAFRAPITEECAATLSISVPEKKIRPFSAKILNISSGGLAFCSRFSEETLPLDTGVEMVIMAAEIPSLKVTGFIRSYTKPTKKDECEKGAMYCGVQFETLSEEMSCDMESFAASVQRKHLRTVFEKANEDSGDAGGKTGKKRGKKGKKNKQGGKGKVGKK